MYYDTLMLREGNLTKAEKEMIVVATSAANNCMYCVVAHGALLRIFSKNPLLGDQVKMLSTTKTLEPKITDPLTLFFVAALSEKTEEVRYKNLI